MSTIRDATLDDATAIASIYNDNVVPTTVGWTEEVETPEHRRAWLATQAEAGNPVLVAIDGASGAVVGFASYGDFRDSRKWPGYRFTVEHTIHVADGQRGAGTGRALMDALIDRAIADGRHRMVGGIDGDNDASIRFHERLGFVQVAHLPEVGFKVGRWLDLVLVQLALDRPRP